mmetsp:Transcript_31733/g.48207  ORF Transcript_31733/g.48207 Transcript_31733/m.48207 type:complete len:113 (-) Transcript_31733:1555-1893(-)
MCTFGAYTTPIHLVHSLLPPFLPPSCKPIRNLIKAFLLSASSQHACLSDDKLMQCNLFFISLSHSFMSSSFLRTASQSLQLLFQCSCFFLPSGLFLFQLFLQVFNDLLVFCI